MQQFQNDSHGRRRFAMVIDDKYIERASEAKILKFVLALWELMQEEDAAVALKEAPSVLHCDKGSVIQHSNGKGSIGPEGWERLGSNGFDIRAYDIWLLAKQKQYRSKK
jgi:hypothetical protein